jgi:hypothetical protein
MALASLVQDVERRVGAMPAVGLVVFVDAALIEGLEVVAEEAAARDPVGLAEAQVARVYERLLARRQVGRRRTPGDVALERRRAAGREG